MLQWQHDNSPRYSQIHSVHLNVVSIDDSFTRRRCRVCSGSCTSRTNFLPVAQCKNAVTNPFDEATLCVQNSTFLVNCGSCQTCIWTYAIENPDLPDMDVLENGVQTLLDLCLNTTANNEVVALESQVSRISALGNILTSGHTPTTTYSEYTMTKTESSSTWTVTGVADPAWTTMLSTASWASYYYSQKSAGKKTGFENWKQIANTLQNPLPVRRQQDTIRQQAHRRSPLLLIFQLLQHKQKPAHRR